MNSSTYLVVEDTSNAHSNQRTSVTSENSRLRIPESPPPPYITPPGTILKNINLASLSASMKQICPVRRTWLRRSVPQFSSNNHSPPSSSTNTETFSIPRTDHVAPNTSRQSENPSKEVHTVHETFQNTTEENNRHSEENYDETIER